MLYRSKTWVLTLIMKRVLGRFHHKVARRLKGWQPRKGWYGGSFYPSLEDVIEEAGLQEMETYVSGRQNKVAQYIATIPIVGLCLAAKQKPGPRVEMRWREHFQTGN